MDRRVFALAFAILLGHSAVLAQTCPAPLHDARRLVLVLTEGMDATPATIQWFERASAADKWRTVAAAEPSVVGRAGIAWAPAFRKFSRPGEPIKLEGDKRAPAGVYPIGVTFGTVPSERSGHIQVMDDTVCVDDPSSPDYNTITSRASIGPKFHRENMATALPMYRRGLLVDYPTDIAAKAGSCIFIHVWRAPTRGTAGCVAMPEERLIALQDFVEGDSAVLAILPRQALSRFGGCLPRIAGGKP